MGKQFKINIQSLCKIQAVRWIGGLLALILLYLHLISPSFYSFSLIPPTFFSILFDFLQALICIQYLIELLVQIFGECAVGNEIPIATDDIVEGQVFDHHLLMMAVALGRRSALDALAHQDVYLYVFTLFAAQVEKITVLYQEVYVFTVLAHVPVVADAARFFRFAGADGRLVGGKFARLIIDKAEGLLVGGLAHLRGRFAWVFQIKIKVH